MSIKTIFNSAVLVMALMCLTFLTAWAQSEVVKTFQFSTANSSDRLTLTMTDPDDNTEKTIVLANGSGIQSNNQQCDINVWSGKIILSNLTGLEDEGQDIEFIIYPNVKGRVTKIEFTNANRGTVIEGNSFSMSIVGMKYNGTSNVLTGTDSWNTKATFSFTCTNNEGIDGNLSIMLAPLSDFSFNSDSKMVITYIPNAAPIHQHNFSFNAVGNTLTATCAHDDGLECSLAESNYQTTLTLTAQDGYYDEHVFYGATHNLSGFNAKTGLNATTNGIVYTVKSDNTTSTSPVNAIGEYTATLVVTIGNNDYTLTTDFSIVSNQVAYTNNHPNLLDCPAYGYSNMDYTATITFHPINGISIRTLTITGANTNLSLGNGITDNGDNTYSFTSPREDATINATFGLTIDGSSSEPISIASDIEVDEVTYSRTFESGSYTVILPFGFDASSVAGTFYTLADIQPETGTVWKAIMSDPVQTIEANKPYIFVPNAPITEIKITGKTTLHKTVDAPLTNVCANTNWKLHGVYSQKVWTDEDVNNYGFAAAAKDEIAAGEFVHFVTGAWIKPTRCYLEYSKDGFSKSAVVLPEKIIVIFPETSSVIEPNDPENNGGDVITPVSEITPSNGTKVWSADKKIVIESKAGDQYRIIDLNGRTLRESRLAANREEVTLSRATGIVIVKINGKSFKVNY